MLYILFGRDKIGKRTVRDFIAKEYGLIVIPKFTSDKEKKWTLKNFTNIRTINDHPITLMNTSFKCDSNEFRQATDAFMRRRGVICSASDDFLRYCEPLYFEQLQSTGYTYQINKIYNNIRYVAKYYIRGDHIKNALLDEVNDYLLVCTSGNVISEIQRYANSLGKSSKVSIIQIIGKQRVDNQNSTWEVEQNLLTYLFENSHKFAGTIYNESFEDSSNHTIDFKKFSYNISKQWETITGMNPLIPRAFFVRPFSDANNEVELNINDIVENRLKNYLNNYLRKDNFVLDINYLSLEDADGKNNFEKMNNSLERSNIIFVDLREMRFNCIYECGFAHALTNIYKSKKVYVMIGVEENDNENYDQTLENLRNMCKKIPYDLSPYNFYKYTVSRNRQNVWIDNMSDYMFKFVDETTAVQSLINTMKDHFSNQLNKGNVNIYKLISND